MKKIFNYAMYLMVGALMSTSMVACSDDEPETELSHKEVMLKKALIPYVDNTVIATYRNMADHAIALYDACLAIQASFEKGELKTTDLIVKAGNEWKKSRKYWEQSEAFLFGAAGDYNIDPHIDSWPLDKNALVTELEAIKNGKEVKIELLGYGLLGFHALEYMLFELDATEEKSLPHNVNYTAEELVYTCAVAEDLRNQCVRLEAAWAGLNNVTKEKADFLSEAELEPTINYGTSMKNAGMGGSLYKTYQEAAEEVLQGSMDICDEVGALKIGKPAIAAFDEDKNYIESPYSLNSITDFQDNIISIKHSYCGSKEGDASISDFIKEVNPSLDAEVIKNIDAAIKAISEMPEPFAKHATEVASKNAMDALETLMGSLESVTAELSK